MVFSSFFFLIVFLPLFLTVYLVSKNNFKNYILLFFSLGFYYYGEKKLIVFLIISILGNWLAAILIERYRKIYLKSKCILTAGIALNLCLLGYLKYANFFIENLNSILNIPSIDVIMPIGISFYTFQAMSYIIDVYRAEIKANRNLIPVATYISMFPQLIAGPIVRYSTVEHELHHRNHFKLEDFSKGTNRFIIGLSKKILIADTMGSCADEIFTIPLDMINTPLAWIGIIAYSLQIYFDFSAYSDMAIGLGRMMGFHFLENFNYPYISKTITEFWRRWHISLSSFLKDYLYIPLGGNRKGSLRTYINLFIVFILCGFWHGASWNFILWGAWFGFFLTLERLLKVNNLTNTRFSVLQHLYTLIVVIIGWVFFRSENITNSIIYLGKLFGYGNSEGIRPWYDYLTSLTLFCGLVGILFSMPIYPIIMKKLKNKETLHWGMIFASSIILLVLGLLKLTAESYSPFLYFRF